MNMIQAVTCCLQKYASAEGRAPRSEYWWFVLFTMLVQWVTTLLNIILKGNMLPTGGSAGIGIIVSLIFFIPSLTVAARRLHDVGKSGWLALLPFTLIGIFPFLYWMVKPSDPGRNAYGDPLL